MALRSLEMEFGIRMQEEMPVLGAQDANTGQRWSLWTSSLILFLRILAFYRNLPWLLTLTMFEG